MEGNFKNVKKLIYEGEAYTKVYAGNIQIWKKPSSFVIKPLPKNKYPDSIEESTAKWTINGLEPKLVCETLIIPLRTFSIVT